MGRPRTEHDASDIHGRWVFRSGLQRCGKETADQSHRPPRGRSLVRLTISEVTGLLFGVDMPDNVVGQTVHSVSCALRHPGESFRLGLVLKGVGGEVDS